MAGPFLFGPIPIRYCIFASKALYGTNIREQIEKAHRSGRPSISATKEKY